MLHSKQWHYSLHRDFQNCYSTRRCPTGFFSSNSSSNSTRVPIQHTSSIHHPHLHVHIQRILHPEIQFYMQKTKSSSSTTTYRGQRDLQSRFQKRNSTHRRQGDLLEIHPCVLQDLPMTFQAFQPQDLTKALQLLQLLQRHSGHSSHSWLSSLSRQFYKFFSVPVFPGNPPHSSILRLECIFYNFYSSIGFHRNSTEYQLNNTNYKHSTNITFFKEREMLWYRSNVHR